MFELLKNRDFRLFIIKFVLFLLLASFGFYVIKFALGHFVPLPVITTNFDRNIIYALFYICLFLLMIRDNIKNIKISSQKWLQTAVFGVLTFISVVAAELLVNVFFTTGGTSPAALVRLYYIEIFLLVPAALLLWLSIFNFEFSKEFIQKFGN
ncbi:MAG: hypothetical protein QXH80_04385, partial [Candidatus Nanoarchaeia archaeon]